MAALSLLAVGCGSSSKTAATPTTKAGATVTTIAADNPGAKLPGKDIVVAHRSDGSGTTENFTTVPSVQREGRIGARSNTVGDDPRSCAAYGKIGVIGASPPNCLARAIPCLR